MRVTTADQEQAEREYAESVAFSQQINAAARSRGQVPIFGTEQSQASQQQADMRRQVAMALEDHDRAKASGEQAWIDATSARLNEVFDQARAVLDPPAPRPDWGGGARPGSHPVEADMGSLLRLAAGRPM